MMEITKDRVREHFGCKILSFRTAHCISQEAMARQLTIAVRSYIDLEHGVCSPSGVTILKFIQLLSPAERESFFRDMLD